MNAEEIYEQLKPNLRRLNRIEKRKLYSRIFSEAHPAFKVKKRGKTRSLSETKKKLDQDFQTTFLKESSN